MAGVLVGALAVVAGVVAWGAGGSPTASASSTETAERTPAVIARRAAADLPAISDAAQLDRYLEKLKEEARMNGRVTALQVEPGLQAIAKLRPQLGDAAALEKSRAFSQQILLIANTANHSAK